MYAGLELAEQIRISGLENALEAWKAYTVQARQQNINPIWTNRVGHVDWLKITEWVANDIELAKGVEWNNL